MTDFSAVSPLLDGFTVGDCLSSRDGVSCYALRHDASGQEFVLKHISVPASEDQLQALLLSGAYPTAEAANEYFRRVADGLAEEFTLSRTFADCPNILHFLAHQVVERTDGAGFDVYAVTDKAVSLEAYAANSALTKLQAINLGLDLCAALCALRAAGYLHQNIKPENVFTVGGRFLLGDLGLVSLQDIRYSSLPEQYIGPYTAPELHDIMAEQNSTTDLYAVGMLLYRIYNGGHAPFEDEKITAKEADRMRLTGKELPVPMYADYELAEILQKACAFRPEDRYQTPEELRLALELYMKRNGIADVLIVPPIVSDPEPEFSEELSEDEPDAPISFTDVSELDDDFIRHFSPDTAALDETVAQMLAEDAREEKARPADDTKSAEEPEPAEETESAPAEESEPAPAEKAETLNPTDGSLPEIREFDAPAAELTLVEEDHSVRRSSKPSAASAGDSKSSRKDRTVRRVVLICLLAILATALLIYFFTPLGQKLYHYTVHIERMDVTEVTTGSVAVRLTANIEQPPVELSCKDAYGNSFTAEPVNGTAVFRGLESGTLYTVTAALKSNAGLHRLTGVTTVTASTLPSTEVLVMTASAGTEEGAVVIDLVVKDGDPEPSAWTVSCSCDGEDSTERTFPGTDRRFEISGLSVGKEYTFRLVSSDLCCIDGETSAVYTTEKEVTAEGLTMESFVDGTLTVRWDCTSEPPKGGWTVTCTDPDGTVVSSETEQCQASFDGLSVGTAYRIGLQASGLFVPPMLDIPDTLVHIDKLTAQEAEDGVHVQWSCSDADPEGWVLLCTPVGGGGTVTAHNAEGTEFVLTDLLPNTVYTLELKSAGKRTAVGHEHLEYTVAMPERFDSRGIKADNAALTLFAVPEKEDWQRKDLDTPKSEFDASVRFAYKLTAPTGRYKGDFSLLYIVRDENGVPVDYGTAQYVWNEVWSWDSGALFGMAGSAEVPDRNGSYTLELYFSYDLEGCIHYKYVASSAPFTVTGAQE